MNSQEHYDPSDLPEPGSPDDINEFIDELDIIAAHSDHAHPASPEQIHASEAVEGRSIRADDLIAGYLPGVNILNGVRPLRQGGRAGRHHRPQRRRQVDPAQGAVRPGEDQLRHGHCSVTRTSPTSGPTSWSTRASASSRRPTTCSRRSPSRRTCRWAPTRRRKRFRERFEFVVELFPTLGDRRKQRAGSLSGRRAADGGDGPGADDGAVSVLLLDEPSAGLCPALQDEVFVRRAGSTGPASP